MALTFEPAIREAIRQQWDVSSLVADIQETMRQQWDVSSLVADIQETMRQQWDVSSLVADVQETMRQQWDVSSLVADIQETMRQQWDVSSLVADVQETIRQQWDLGHFAKEVLENRAMMAEGPNSTPYASHLEILIVQVLQRLGRVHDRVDSVGSNVDESTRLAVKLFIIGIIIAILLASFSIGLPYTGLLPPAR
jgi:hypothetical protein